MAQSNQGNVAELNAKIQNLEAQLKETKKKGNLSLKVSQKGAVSVYGLGRFPVTLYKGQWEKLLTDSFVKDVQTFIKDNSASLSVK